MNTKIKYIISTIVLLIILGNIFASIDYSRIKNNNKPLLSIYTGKHKSTKADMYYGLGYTIIKCPEVNDIKPEYQLILLSNNHICLAGFSKSS